MDAAAIAGLCLVLAHGGAASSLPDGVQCPAQPRAAVALDGVDLAAKVSVPGARDAMARVAFAEAGNQGDSGLAGVIYTLLNRLADGRWGMTVDTVLNAPSQFEPVMRVGGDWRRLPPVSAAQQARVDVILNLALEGRLPDLTQGARYFQNPAVVAARARSGSVSGRLVNFGGQTPSAVIGAHSFFTGGPAGARGSARSLSVGEVSAPDRLFVGAPRPVLVNDTPNLSRPPGSDGAADPGVQTGDPSRALFIAPDGRVSADRR